MCQKLEGADEVSKKYFDECINELVHQQLIEEEENEIADDDEEKKEEINIETEKESIKNVLVQKENDNIQTNMGTSVKIELNKKDKKESKTKGENNKIISDVF